MKAFVTGSHAYGKPHEDSDIDLVVLVSDEDMERLLDAHALDNDDDDCPYDDMTSAYIRFGRLNLLCVTCERDYAVWREGTDELIARKPVSREEAVKVFKRRQAEAKDADYAAAGAFYEAKAAEIDGSPILPAYEA